MLHTAGSSTGHQLILTFSFHLCIWSSFRRVIFVEISTKFSCHCCDSLINFLLWCFQSVFCYIYTHHVCCIINSCTCLFAFQSINIKCAKQDPFSSLSISTESNTERENNRRWAQQPCSQSCQKPWRQFWVIWSGVPWTWYMSSQQQSLPCLLLWCVIKRDQFWTSGLGKGIYIPVLDVSHQNNYSSCFIVFFT